MFVRIILGIHLALLCMTATAVGQSSYSPPQWARGAIWYEIIPDRFEDGDSLNNSYYHEIFSSDSSLKWTSNWYSLTEREKQQGKSFYINASLRRYGGDLQGILNRLDYLEDLGVDVLYLTSIFTSVDPLHYSVSDHRHVDPHLGPMLPTDSSFLAREVPDDPKSWYLTSADRMFLDLIAEAHERGIRVVIDGIFPFVSVDFWAFKDVLKKLDRSLYKDWFNIRQWDRPETPDTNEFTYDARFGLRALPLFKSDSLGLVEGPKKWVFAITKRWMDPDGDGDPSDGVDGWRIEGQELLPSGFWGEWASFVKSINPNAVVVGEQWSREDAKDNPYCDTFLDYVFGRVVRKMFFDSTAVSVSVVDALLSNRSSVFGNAEAMDLPVNVISSHETDRVASMAANPGYEYDAENSPDENPRYNTGPPDIRQRLRLKAAILFQFTYPGCPLIYYGDEAGMWGGDVPDNRKPMVWFDKSYQQENPEIVTGKSEKYRVVFDSVTYSLYKSMIQLRKHHPALRTGDMKTILMDNATGLYGFMRSAGSDKVVAIFNSSASTQLAYVMFPGIQTGTKIIDPINGEYFFHTADGVTIQLPPKGATVLIPQR